MTKHRISRISREIRECLTESSVYYHLGTVGDNVTQIKKYTFLRKHATGQATSELHIVLVERGMPWVEAMSKWSELTGSAEGFYISHHVRNGNQNAILAVAAEAAGRKTENLLSDATPYLIYRPNTGLQTRRETLGEIQNKYRKVTTFEAEPHWNDHYESSENTCSHTYWTGTCKQVTLGRDCEVGVRRRYVLCGSVFSVQNRVEKVLASQLGANSKMQIIRLKTDEGNIIIGILIPKSCVEALRQDLATDSESTFEEIF